MGRVHHHFGGGDPRGPVEVGVMTFPMYHVETTAPVTDEMLEAILCNLYNVGYFVQTIYPTYTSSTDLTRYKIIAYLRKG